MTPRLASGWRQSPDGSSAMSVMNTGTSSDGGCDDACAPNSGATLSSAGMAPRPRIPGRALIALRVSVFAGTRTRAYSPEVPSRRAPWVERDRARSARSAPGAMRAAAKVQSRLLDWAWRLSWSRAIDGSSHPGFGVGSDVGRAGSGARFIPPWWETNS